MDRRYHMNVFWSADDEAWIADVPDLRFCSAFGQTPEIAIAEVQVAIAAWIESAEADEMPIPAPRYRPVIYTMPFAA